MITEQLPRIFRRVEFDTTASIRDGKRPAADILAEMYADLGAERDDFERKSQVTDALRKERDDLIVEKSTLTTRVTELKVRLNRLYGISVEAAAHPTLEFQKSPQLSKLDKLIAENPKERKTNVAALKLPALRKMLHAALAYMEFDRRTSRRLDHQIHAERTKLEERIETQGSQIEDAALQVGTLKLMFEDHKKQRTLGETREADLQKKIDALKIESGNQTRERIAAQMQRDTALTEASMLRTLCRAQHEIVKCTIIDQHFVLNATERS
jgi:hypothetical protein